MRPFFIFLMFLAYFSTLAQPTLLLQKGHTLPIVSVCVNHDNTVLASLDTGKKLVLWDIKSGKQKKELQLEMFEAWNASIYFSTRKPSRLIIDSRKTEVLYYDLKKDEAEVVYEASSDRGDEEYRKVSSMQISIRPYYKTAVGPSLMSAGGQYYVYRTYFGELYIGDIIKKEVAFQDPSFAVVHQTKSTEPDTLPFNNPFFLFGGGSGSIAFNENNGRLVSVHGSRIKAYRFKSLDRSLDFLFEDSLQQEDPHWLSPAADILLFVKGGELWRGDIAQTGWHQQSLHISAAGITEIIGGFGIGDCLLLRDIFKVEVLSMTTGKISFSRRENLAVEAATISPDGQFLVTALKDHTIHLWNIRNGRVERTFRGHVPLIDHIALSDDDEHLFVHFLHEPPLNIRLSEGFEISAPLESVITQEDLFGSPDGKLWTEISSAYPRPSFVIIHGVFSTDTLRFPREFAPHLCAFSPDSKLLAVADRYGAVQLYQAQDSGWRMIRHIDDGDMGYVNGIAFHPLREFLTIAYTNGVVVYDWHNDPVLELNSFRFAFSKFDRDAIKVFYSPDGQYLILRGFPQAEIFRSAPDGQLSRIFPDNLKPAESPFFVKGLINVAFKTSMDSPHFLGNEELIIFETKDNTLEIWPFDKISAELIKHRGYREDFTEKPLYTIDARNIAYESFVLMKTRPIILFNCAAEGIVMVNWETGKRLATIVVASPDKFIIFDEKGRYYTSPQGYDLVAFQIKDKVYPVEQFDAQYNQPQEVLKEIGLSSPELIEAYGQAFRKRQSRTGGLPGNPNHVPTVRIVNTDIPLSTNHQLLSLEIEAEDTRYKIDRIFAFVNDVPVFGSKGLEISGVDVKRNRNHILLQLSAGRNKIQVSARNSEGVESLKETLEVIYYPPATQLPDLYVLAVGVSRYRESKYNLDYAAKDAADLAAFFQQARRFEKVHIRTIFDEEATRAQILGAKVFLQKSRVDDEVIVFLSGHGMLGRDYNFYFGTHDIDFNHPAETGLSIDEIEGLLDSIGSRKKLLLLDACHSGELDKPETREYARAEPLAPGVKAKALPGPGDGVRLHLGMNNTFALMKALFADLRRGSGATMITSSGGAEYSFEGEGFNNGVFTFALLQGLHSGRADLNADGSIVASELSAYTERVVTRLTRNKQRPSVRRVNLENDFRIW